MLSKIISYSLTIIFAVSLVANEKPSIISSHRVTIDTTKNDSIRLERLIDLSWDYRNYKIDSAVYYSDWAIRLAKTINQPRLLAKELDIRSTIYIIQNKLDSAEDYQWKSLNLRSKLKDFRGLRSSYEEMGNIKRAKGYYDLALSYYFKSLSTIDSIAYRPVELELYEETEFENLEKYIAKFRKNNFDMKKYTPEASSVKFVHEANTKRLIGDIYLIKKDYKNAELYLYEALELNYRLLDGDQIMMNENSMCKLYLDLGNLDEARKHAIRCTELSSINGNYSEAATAFKTLTEIERRKKNFSQSLIYLDSVYYYKKLFAANKKWDKLLIPRLRILIDSSEVSKSTELDSTMSIIVSKISNLDIEDKINPNERMELYYTLFNYYYHTDNKDSTICYQTSYYLLKDSIIGLETQNRLSELLELHESKKKTKTIHNQANQIISYNDSQTLLIVILFIIILFVVYMIYSNRKMKKLNTEVLALNSQLTESTKNKEQLYSYIAHDLRSPLITTGRVIDMILSNNISSERKDEYLQQLSQTVKKSEMFTDNLMHWAKTKTGTITPIIREVDLREVIAEAVDLFVNELPDKDIMIEQSLADMTIETDRLLLQAIVNNLLQNAVRYGNNGSIIQIVTTQDNNSWELSITNSGKTMPTDTIEKFNNSEIIHNEIGNGIGLTIIKNYTNLLGISCAIHSESDTTTFTISNK
ncbi:MAG: tetratricopeptide repeat-containing sensor histidine kinase [Candidatus Kapaibacterium sp.]